LLLDVKVTVTSARGVWCSRSGDEFLAAAAATAAAAAAEATAALVLSLALLSLVLMLPLPAAGGADILN
jgi:hypothetical protein